MIKDMLSSLLVSGMTQRQISDETGVAQPAISRIINGRQEEVSYSCGKAVEALYVKVCKPPHKRQTRKAA